MVTKIVKFGAKWCNPCRALDKTLEKVKGVEIVKYDLDNMPELAEKENIKNIPTIVFYNNDKEIKRITGAISLAEINKIINE